MKSPVIAGRHRNPGQASTAAERVDGWHGFRRALERRVIMLCRRSDGRRRLTTRLNLPTWLIHGAVPVRKGVPAGGDSAAARGGGRLGAGRRLSLEGSSFSVGWAIGGWKLTGDWQGDTGGLFGQPEFSRLSALRPESVMREKVS